MTKSALPALLAILVALQWGGAAFAGPVLTGAESSVEILADPPMVWFRNAPRIPIPERTRSSEPPKRQIGFCDKPDAQCVTELLHRTKMLKDKIWKVYVRLYDASVRKGVKAERLYAVYSIKSQCLIARMTLDRLKFMVRQSVCSPRLMRSSACGKFLEEFDRMNTDLRNVRFDLRGMRLNYVASGFDDLAQVCDALDPLIEDYSSDMLGYIMLLEQSVQGAVTAAPDLV